jgi:tRNA (cmo5U34)-methyltransferase
MVDPFAQYATIFAVAPDQQLRSWSSEEFVSEWVGGDVVARMLELPRQISTALVADAELQVRHVVDLGSGPGAYLEAFLQAFPAATGTWIDSSESMEPIARERLAGFGDRVAYRLAGVEELEGLALGPASVIVTSRVVHHLSPEAIQALYRSAFDLIEPGGFFFNLDHYGSPAGWEPRYRRIRKTFLAARDKQIAPHRHDHPFSQVPAHLNWLDEAGFEAPDVPWRTFYTALLAGRRPA